MERSDADHPVTAPPQLRSAPEEVTRLLQELVVQRELLREISARIAAIEKHVRRAFQVPKAKSKPRGHEHAPGAARRSSSELLALFDQLRALWTTGHTADAKDMLGALPTDELRLLSAELGGESGKRMSRTALSDAVTRKLRESEMLGSNVTLEDRPSFGGDGQERAAEKPAE